jgi:hypothetical protein
MTPSKKFSTTTPKSFIESETPAYVEHASTPARADIRTGYHRGFATTITEKARFTTQ